MTPNDKNNLILECYDIDKNINKNYRKILHSVKVDINVTKNRQQIKFGQIAIKTLHLEKNSLRNR